MPNFTYFQNLTDRNITSPVDLVSYNNDVTVGLFTVVLTLGLWAIIFLGIARNGYDKAFIAASGITWMASVLLWAGGMLAEWVMLTYLLATATVLIIKVYTGQSGPKYE